MKSCSACGTQDEAQFAPTQKYKCRGCTNAYSQTNYRANKPKIIKQSCGRNSLRIAENRKKMFEFLQTHPCVTCGEADIVVLEFDHLGDKQYNVSNMVASSFAWSTILEEVSKCEVVCCNCHRRRTAQRHGGWYRSIGV